MFHCGRAWQASLWGHYILCHPSCIIMQSGALKAIKGEKWQGTKLKKIVRSPFGDQLEKYSRQMQILSRLFV